MSDVKQGLLSPYLLRKSLNFWKNEIANLTLHFHRCVTRKFFQCRSPDSPDRNTGAGGRRLLELMFFPFISKKKNTDKRHQTHKYGKSDQAVIGMWLQAGLLLYIPVVLLFTKVEKSRLFNFRLLISYGISMKDRRALKNPIVNLLGKSGHTRIHHLGKRIVWVHNKEVYSWSMLFPFRKISFTNLSKTS